MLWYMFITWCKKSKIWEIYIVICKVNIHIHKHTILKVFKQIYSQGKFSIFDFLFFYVQTCCICNIFVSQWPCETNFTLQLMYLINNDVKLRTYKYFLVYHTWAPCYLHITNDDQLMGQIVLISWKLSSIQMKLINDIARKLNWIKLNWIHI